MSPAALASSGGLVPGVDVYAYMTHLPVQRWGRAWLEHGTAECRFIKPVYDGDIVIVTASESATGSNLRLESHGELCATGRAALPLPPSAPPGPLEEAPSPPPPSAMRPPADESTLAVGTRFAINPLRITDEFAEEYLRTVRESEPLYGREGLVHPGTIIAYRQLGVAPQCRIGAVDACRQHSAAFRCGPDRR